MKKRIGTLDEFINEGGVKNAMYELIEEITQTFANAKGIAAKKIAKDVESICGYDPTDESEEDFETALWELSLEDLHKIINKIK